MQRKLESIIFSVSLTCFYIFLLHYFKSSDIYDNHFFDTGFGLIYNLSRVSFIFYFCAIICVPGYAALAAVGGRTTFAQLPPLARLTGSFFCGAACWHSLLLVLGFLNLYVYPVAVALTVPAVALAAPLLGGTFSEVCRDARAQLRLALPAIAWVTRCLAVLALTTAVVLLIVKGLFPAGGHDYFNHYHGYYEAVLRNHGLWPNDVWYQFYYSKGMGLFFLGMMLSDPLAPSLVTYCFALATGMALFLLVDRMSMRANFWPWVTVIAFFVLYTYTPGMSDYLLNGGWGDFQKPHEVDAAFVIAFLWLCAELKSGLGRERRIWLAAAGACAFTVAFIELVTVLLLGLCTVMLTALALICRRADNAGAFFVLSAVGGCGLLVVLAINYVVTGLPSDQLLPAVWPWVNLKPLSEWGALPYLVILMQGLEGMRAQGHHFLGMNFVFFFHDLLRIDLLNPLLIKTPIFLTLLAGAAAFRFWYPCREQNSAPITVLLVFLVALAAAAATAGVVQPISFYRYTSFTLAAMLGVAGCGWLYIAASIRTRWLSGLLSYVLPLVLLAAALGQFYRSEAAGLKQVIPNAIAFARGSISIRQAYGDQQGWAGRHPWGGIFPGIVGAWQTAGPGARIWSMHLAAYCMLPHCRSETFYSFILSPDLLDMLAGSAEETRDILQHESLNYFFFTTEMDVNDILPLTKLFASDQIASYLGVKWTDGKSYLLTWLGPGVTRLTPECVAQYKKAVDSAPYQPTGFPLKLMLSLREQMSANPHWGRELKLPGIPSD